MNSQNKCPVPMYHGDKRWLDGDLSWRDCLITIRDGGCPRCGGRLRSMLYKCCEKMWSVCEHCYPDHCMLMRGAEDNSHPIGAVVWE